MNWRHRVGLMEQWNRLNLALTAKLLKIMYGSSFPEIGMYIKELQQIELAVLSNNNKTIYTPASVPLFCVTTYIFRPIRSLSKSFINETNA